MTAIQSFDFSTQTLLNHLLKTYVGEKNFEMAIALHRGLKWELVALEYEDEIKNKMSVVVAEIKRENTS